MRRIISIFITGIVSACFLFAGCNVTPQDPGSSEEQIDPDDLEKLKATIPVTHNWVYDKRPEITIRVENPNKVAVSANAKVRINTDQMGVVTTVEKKDVIVPANESVDIVLTTETDLDPGFYKAFSAVNGKGAKTFNFGVSPFEIVSAPDYQPDFNEFWNTAKQQLSGIDINASLTEISITSSYKLYMVEIQSVPDGLTGDPVIVRGYYLEPLDGKKHPVLMHFQGYDTLGSSPSISLPSGSGEYAEFFLSHRGQYLNRSSEAERAKVFGKNDGKGDFENKYNDWFAYNFGNKDAYYYRGAFMDCVRAVQFMATRTTSDMNNLFAEGSSQGGALCYAAAALSDYPFSAIAPNVAFLGDFPDYFKIASWPANVAKENQGAMTDEQMYAFLSYFDTKNLATKIPCAVWATSGLQDGTCPSHTNVAPFNNLKSTDKTMTFYPEMQHSYPPNWNSDILSFFKARMK